MSLEQSIKETNDFARKNIIIQGTSVPRIWVATSNYFLRNNPGVDIRGTLYGDMRARGLFDEPNSHNACTYLEERFNIHIDYAKFKEECKAYGVN